MPISVTAYRVRQTDTITGEVTESKHYYTLDEIAKLHEAVPILEDQKQVLRYTRDEWQTTSGPQFE